MGRTTKPIWAGVLAVALLVAAAVELIGDRIWWPSSARGGGAALKEAPVVPEAEREPERTPAG